MIPEQALLPQGTQQFVYVVGADKQGRENGVEIVIGTCRMGPVMWKSSRA